MIRTIDRRSASLLELFRRAKLADQMRRGEAAPEETANPREASAEIIGRRDERGVPYPGDFPTDLARYYRGCF
jgi:hypothetical protein